MKLTDRLATIARQVEKGERVADIGTDHGYLPVYLYMEGVSPEVILTDISEGSLAKAEKTCKEYCPNKKFDLRRGDGLDVLKKGEVDTAVAAGMGGILMTEMLEWDMEKTCSIKKYIFQPRNHIHILRKWLTEKGFEIEKENLVREGRYICEILTVRSPESFEKGTVSFENPEEDIKYEFPEYLVKDSNELTEEYLKRKLDRIGFIMGQIEKGNREDPENISDYRLMMLRKERLESLLELLKKGEI